MKFYFLFFFLLVLNTIPSLALAETSNDPFVLPEVMAVENKMFQPKHDITAGIGILPLDAFYKAVTAGLSYTYSYNSFLGWEVFNAQYATKQDTGLKNDLINDFQVQPDGILDYIDYTIGTHLVYTPIYSKNLFFNKSIVHGEMSFVGGGGIVGFHSKEVANMFGGGIILRFFDSNLISYKFDSRVYYHTGKQKSSDLVLNINFGLSFELGDNGKRKVE